MGNLSDPNLSIILGAIMGLLGGLISIPVNAVAFWKLKSYEQENQRKLELFAKKQELLLQHRLELQRQNKAHSEIKASIAQLKTTQKQHTDEINRIVATHAEAATDIRNSLTDLGQKTVSLTNMGFQMNEHILQIEKTKADEVTSYSAAAIAQMETRLAELEELHNPLKRDS